MNSQLKKFPSAKNLKMKKPVGKEENGSLSGHSKDIYSFENGRNNELSDNEYYTLVIAKLNSRFHIVINSSGIHDYKEITKYVCLESKMSVIYLEDIINEDSHFFTTEELETTIQKNFNLFDISFESFSKMQLHNLAPKNNKDTYQETKVENERKNKQMAKRIIEIKSKIHNSILDFYKVITVEDPHYEIAPGIQYNMVPPEDIRLDMIAGLV